MESKAMELAVADPKGLVRESYLIEGITLAECKSIFIDWALSLAAGVSNAEALNRLLAEYGAQANHPMTGVLNQALIQPATPHRRGGRIGRMSA
jgi:hypothetical protein